MRRQADGKMAPRYPTLYRKGINVDCPEDWYLVNIKAADYGAISEIATYVAKGDEIVQAGPVKIVEYLNARRGRRMLQGLGYMYKVGFMEDEAYETPTAPGECPYSDCRSHASRLGSLSVLAFRMVGNRQGIIGLAGIDCIRRG